MYHGVWVAPWSLGEGTLTCVDTEVTYHGVWVTPWSLGEGTLTCVDTEVTYHGVWVAPLGLGEGTHDEDVARLQRTLIHRFRMCSQCR